MAGKTARVLVVGPSYVEMAIKCRSLPSAGESCRGSSLSYSTTGAGPNQAVQAKLCGCEVHLMSKVGACPFGKVIKETLEGYGLNLDFLYTAEAKNSGAIVTVVNAKGENSTCIYSGANNSLTSAEVYRCESVIEQADVCLIQANLPREAVLSVLRLAKLHRSKVILDPAGPIDLTDTGALRARYPDPDYLAGNILVPNLYEAADITEHSAANIRTAKLIGSELVAGGAEAAVITMGKHGCMVVDKNGADHIPAFGIELVDQSCTGDAFGGALAASCAVGDKLRDAVRFASAAGALVCTKFGSLESLPSHAEIIGLLQNDRPI